MAKLIETLEFTDSLIELKENDEFTNITIDFKEKHICYISVILKFNEYVPQIENVYFKYGPLIDFTVASGIFETTIQNKELHLSLKLPIALRFLNFQLPLDIGRQYFDWNIIDARLSNVEKDVKKQGSFTTNDKMLNDIWETGANTIRLCMMPNHLTGFYRNVIPKEKIDFIDNWRGEGDNYVLVDGCRRDREVWIGDLLPELRTCLYVFNDFEVVKNSIRIFASQQNKDGFIVASSVSGQDFLEYCCWYVICIWEYYLISGDKEFLLELKESIIDVLGYIASKRSQNNLLELKRMQTWAWTLARCGHITSSNCVQVMSLKAGANCLLECGEKEKAQESLSISEKVSQAICDNGFDEEIGSFRDVADGVYPYYSLDANALAILSGVADKKQTESSLKFIQEKLHSPYGSKTIYPEEREDGKNWPHNTEIWPFVVNFELDARFESSDDKNAIDLIKRCWGNMVSQGNSTFWEIVDGKTGEFMKRAIFENQLAGLDRWNSYCHGWSAGVSYSLSAYIGGIKPLKAGFREFSFDPHPCGLESVSVKVPVGKEFISVEYQKISKNSYEGTIEIPNRLVAHFDSKILKEGIHKINFNR